MVSEVTIGDIRGLLLDTDKRPVLRLLPQMDEVCREYAIDHLGDAGCSLEDIASQVWLLNATDWIRGQDCITGYLCKNLNHSGFSRVLHEFAIKVAEDPLRFHEKQGGRVLKESWELLDMKRRWIDGEISDKELGKARAIYRDIYRIDVYLVADRAAYSSADLAAYLAAYWAAYGTVNGIANGTANEAIERKKQVNLLGDMLEDSVGIERGVKGESLESKVSGGGL